MFVHNHSRNESVRISESSVVGWINTDIDLLARLGLGSLSIQHEIQMIHDGVVGIARINPKCHGGKRYRQRQETQQCTIFLGTDADTKTYSNGKGYD